MCKGNLFGQCDKTRCRYRHCLLRCTRASCTYNKCKMIHLSFTDFSKLRENIRPFEENIAKELERVAFAYFSIMTIEQRDQHCSGKLTGGKCYRPTCMRCTEPTIPFARCCKCKNDLENNRSHRLTCMHVVCTFCLDRLPLRYEALVHHECPLCQTYEYAYELY